MIRAPHLRFADPQLQLELLPRTVEVSQAVGKIDYADIVSRQVAPGSRKLNFDGPIQFAWGSSTFGLDLTTQLGYIAGVEDVTDKFRGASQNWVSIKVLGTGNTLRDKRSRAWNDTTVQEVISSVLAAYRINLVMDAHLVRYGSIVQSNESDWAFVCRLIKDKLGYWGYLNGTTMYVLNPDTLATRMAPVMVESAASNTVFQQTTDFSQLGGAQVADRVGRFVDQATGQVVDLASRSRVGVNSSARPSVGRKLNLTIDADSYTEAEAQLAADERNAAWHIERKVTIDGRCDIRPLMALQLRNQRVARPHGAGIEQGWEQYDGVWLVKGMDAKLNLWPKSLSYTTELTLVRDSRGSQLNERQRRAAPLNFNQQPPSRLVNGTWVSSWRNR